MRAATYIRMSTDKQEDSPERQRMKLEGYMARAGLSLYKEYLDEGVRGWADDRPAFKRLVADIEAQRVNVIVVDEISRLSREETLDYLCDVIRPLKRLGVQLHSVSEGGRQCLDTLYGIIMAALHSDKASGESKKLGERVTGAYLNRLQTHSIDLGAAPFGYRRVIGTDGRPTYVIHEEEARLVRMIFSLYAERDLSVRDIAMQLTARGISTPRGKPVWSASSVQAILRDLKYTGAYVFGRTTTGRYFRLGDDPRNPSVGNGLRKKKVTYLPKEQWRIKLCSHPAIIPMADFVRIEATMRDNRTRTTPVKNRGDFLLAKLLRCGKCGSMMTGQRLGRGSDEVFYRCSGAMTRGSSFCLPNVVYEAEVLTHLEGLLRSQFNEDYLVRAERIMAETIEVMVSKDAQAELRGELTKLEKDIERHNRRMAADIPDSTYQVLLEEVKRAEARKKVVEAELGEDAHPTYVARMDDIMVELRKDIAGMGQAFDSKDRQLIRAWLHGHVAWMEMFVEAKPWGKTRRTYDLKGGRVWLKSGTGMNPKQESVSLSTTGSSCGQAAGWSMEVFMPPICL